MLLILRATRMLGYVPLARPFNVSIFLDFIGLSDRLSRESFDAVVVVNGPVLLEPFKIHMRILHVAWSLLDMEAKPLLWYRRIRRP